MKNLARWLVLSFYIFIPQAYSSSLINDSNVIHEQTCFRNQYESYDAWINKITEEARQQTQSEYRVKRRVRNFKRFFKRDSFENYQESLACTTFTKAKSRGRLPCFDL